MDSMTVNVAVETYVELAEDNSPLNPTNFKQYRHDAARYSVIGTDTLELDRLYYNTIELDGSDSIAINLASLPVEPAGVGSGGALVKLVQMHIKLLDNADGSTNSSGLRFGDATGVDMAKLHYGDVSVTFDIGEGGFESHYNDAGTAVGGNSIKFTNLDSTDTVTFSVLLTGRSA